MPLIKHGELACWERFELEGMEFADPSAADTLENTKLQIGFLNMMPDRAVKATERQFLRLLAAGPKNHPVKVHPFTIPGLSRQTDVKRYVSLAYQSFDEIQSLKLDGLVLTGANPGNSEITAEKFWPHFEEVVHWANANVPTVLCSCLASHAILKIFHGIERNRCKPDKRWGVYSHQVTQNQHPLMAGMPASYEEPRSHVFEMTAQQLEPHGIQILASSADADFGVAVSKDGNKWVFLQGHPEYDAVSLLKEYKRELERYAIKERNDYPKLPFNYLPESAHLKLLEFRSDYLRAEKLGQALPTLPESELLESVDNTWSNHAKVLYRNWLQLVARLKNDIKPDIHQQKSA